MMTEPTNKTGYDSFDKYVCPVMFVAAKSPVLSRSHELKTILHNPILRYLIVLNPPLCIYQCISGLFHSEWKT